MRFVLIVPQDLRQAKIMLLLMACAEVVANNIILWISCKSIDY